MLSDNGLSLNILIMKKYKKILFYVIVNGIIILLLIWIAKQGKSLEHTQINHTINSQTLTIEETPFQSIKNNFHHSLSILIIQIIIILLN